MIICPSCGTHEMKDDRFKVTSVKHRARKSEENTLILEPEEIIVTHHVCINVHRFKTEALLTKSEKEYYQPLKVYYVMNNKYRRGNIKLRKKLYWQRYYEANRERLLIYKKIKNIEYNKNNVQKIRKIKQAYYLKHRERLLKAQRERYRRSKSI